MCVFQWRFVSALLCRWGDFVLYRGEARVARVLVLQIFFRAILSDIYESYYIGSC